MQPVTVVLVDLLTANLYVNVRNQIVAHPVKPAELRARAVRGLEHYLRQRGLQVHTVDQVTVTADGALYLLAEVRGAIERLLNGLHREVGVATVYDLEDKVIPSLSGNFGAVAPQGLDYNLDPRKNTWTHYHLVSELHSCRVQIFKRLIEFFIIR